MTYFDRLAAHLRDHGAPEADIKATLDDLAAYIAESGTTPEDEFGPAEAFAAELTASDTPLEVPAPDAETWSFHADCFNDVRTLNRFGDEGWELTSYDTRTGYNVRRTLDQTQRWEYRREIQPPVRHKSTAARLAPEGWEPAATWTFWLYLKRPKATTQGPTAELPEPPPTPHEHTFWTRRLPLYLLLITLTIEALAVGTTLALTEGRLPDGAARGFVLGALLGGLIGTALALAFFLRDLRSRK
ncbi:DUF2812 domain-containing protein [Spirillospora sp. CA-294931]|uniref:DUF2812 domain-containing protein n=1 Tax=Spirillospora sp. CA-294931 TaxID=3240042 RepID=UPI003D8BC0D1